VQLAPGVCRAVSKLTTRFNLPAGWFHLNNKRKREWEIMPNIKANAGIITQINVFTVPMGGQQALIDHLREAVGYASTLPGWRSASLHKSLDGTRVINYAQSDSMESALAIIGKLRERGFLDRNKIYGEAHPGLYEVVFVSEK
jgi:hypothetical protein